MHYLVKLVIGGSYRYKGVSYELNVEQTVSQEVYEYFSTLFDTKLIDQGDKKAIIKVPLFACRTQEFSAKEKVAEEIKDAPDSLRPKRTKQQEAE